MKIDIAILGKMSYTDALRIQKKIRSEVMENKRNNTLLLVEHPHVFTMGRRTDGNHLLRSVSNLERDGIELHRIDRGGDITYHGPGQIVGYPIVNLKSINKTTKRYIESLEELFIHLLRDFFNTEAASGTGKYTGVWVGERKITAIGVEIKRYVTMHGFAFNVNTDLNYFNWIVPCGLGDRGVTSLKEITGEEQNMEKLFQMVAEYFCQVFELEPTFCTLNDLDEEFE